MVSPAGCTHILIQSPITPQNEGLYIIPRAAAEAVLSSSVVVDGVLKSRSFKTCAIIPLCASVVMRMLLSSVSMTLHPQNSHLSLAALLNEVSCSSTPAYSACCLPVSSLLSTAVACPLPSGPDLSFNPGVDRDSPRVCAADFSLAVRSVIWEVAYARFLTASALSSRARKIDGRKR